MVNLNFGDKRHFILVNALLGFVKKTNSKFIKSASVEKLKSQMTNQECLYREKVSLDVL